MVDGVILEDLSNVSAEDFISGNANTLISSSVANLNPNDIESFQVLKKMPLPPPFMGKGGKRCDRDHHQTRKKLGVNYTGNFSGSFAHVQPI